ncbi:MAG: ferritin-like protein [Alphaproteobacteria bacterium]
MLKIEPAILEQVRSATKASDLYTHLQGAIELEHSTVPPYLAALYSIKKGANREAAAIIRSVVIEEMLHMTIAANTLNAIGGTPQINKSNFIPRYPGPLPMNIHAGFKVGLAPLSRNLISNTFMVIEEPEDPLHFPVRPLALEATSGFATIGDFYRAIMAKITELGNGIFTGDPARQVSGLPWFDAAELFPIGSRDDAVRALGIIVEQGEGTKTSPLDPEHELAHYYRFAEIFNGRKLVPDKTAPKGFSYSGAPVALDQTGIWDMVTNPKLSDYPDGSAALRYADQFNFSYGNLLNSLHDTFNGAPGRLDQAIGLMYELRLTADRLIGITLSNGKQAAPTFEYAAVNV